MGEDARSVEMETLEAIWPELRYPLLPASSPGAPPATSPYTFELELPVQPLVPVNVTFTAAGPLRLEDSPERRASSSTQPPSSRLESSDASETYRLSYLPHLSLRTTLPHGYPRSQPPQVLLSTTPQWLSRDLLSGLEAEGQRMWDEIGRDHVVYAYIDHIQRAAESLFGLVDSHGRLAMDPAHKLAILDHDKKAKRAAFERETFSCDVCLEPKKGSHCHKMLDCGHIFCLPCLREFYSDAIQEGNLSAVRCLSPNCAKQRAAPPADGSQPLAPRRKKKVAISPGELLQIGLSEEVVQRYVTLKYRTELEADKNTVYCPRRWCNGAARSKKHKKPSGLLLVEESDDDSDPDVDPDPETRPAADLDQVPHQEGVAAKPHLTDRLSICVDCGFAFCNRCLQTWHGELVRCAPKRDKGEVSEEEKASLEYLRLHTSSCPTCCAPAQKTHGCNHMICSRCDTHFCYLCSSWLDPANPYQHYNQQPDGKLTSCHMRLWELEGGDGDDVGLGFAGGVPNQPLDHGEVDLADVMEPELVVGPANDAIALPQHVRRQPPPEPMVAREAPLVLRLVDNPARGQNMARPGGAAADAPDRGRGGETGP